MATSTSETKQVSGPVSEKDLKLKRFLIEEAKAVGFDAVAFTTPDTIPQAPQRLRQYIADGHHADMLWMEETEDRRANPSVLWPEVRSIMILAMNYGPDSDPLTILEHKDRAAISVYAQNRDYHDIIKGKLKHVASRFAARAGQDVKVFVDTAPVMEKPLAEAAGLGWQGKHTNLVSREHGSWLFLGSILRPQKFRPIDLTAIIAAPAVPVSTLVRRTRFPRPIGSMRDAAFPISPLRIRGRSRTSFANRWATASMVVTIVCRSAPGINSHKRPAR